MHRCVTRVGEAGGKVTSIDLDPDTPHCTSLTALCCCDHLGRTVIPIWNGEPRRAEWLTCWIIALAYHCGPRGNWVKRST